jgi:hypothetical protein
VTKQNAQAWFFAVAACSALLGAGRDPRAQQQPTGAMLPSPLHVEQVVRFARSRRAEIIAAHARTRAAAQRPTILSLQACRSH